MPRKFRRKAGRRVRGRMPKKAMRRVRAAKSAKVVKTSAIGFPDSYFCKLKLSLPGSITPNGTSVAYKFPMIINTLYEPTAAPVTIPGFSDLAAIYGRARVYGCKLRVHYSLTGTGSNLPMTAVLFFTNAPNIGTVAATAAPSTLSEMESWTANPNCYFKYFIGGQGNPTVIDKYIDLRKLAGSGRTLMSDDTFSANTGGGALVQANPANKLYAGIAVYDETGAAIPNTATIGINIQFTWYCQFFERVWFA